MATTTTAERVDEPVARQAALRRRRRNLSPLLGLAAWVVGMGALVGAATGIGASTVRARKQ